MGYVFKILKWKSDKILVTKSTFDKSWYFSVQLENCHSPTQPQLELGVTKEWAGPPPPPHHPVKLLGHFQTT